MADQKAANDGGKLDELRQSLLLPTLEAASFEGFTRSVFRQAAVEVGNDANLAEIAWPHGASDVLAFWSSEADWSAAAAIHRADEVKRIRERVTLGVWARIEYFSDHKEAAQRAATALALPSRQPLSAKLTWRAADQIWRALGDTSTDFNFYSKRAILSGVISSTMLRWLTDDSDDGSATRRFLDARIDNVMQIEKVKGRVKKFTPDLAGIANAFGKARYGRNH